MGWGKPWREPPEVETTRTPRRSRVSTVAVASTATHIGLFAWWLLACAPNSVPLVPARLDRPAIRVAVAHAATTPVETARPVPEPPPRRFEWLAVNRARPDVVLAWSTWEVAYSNDDGETFTVSRLPRPSWSEAAWFRNGIVTSSGEGLVELEGHSWWRVDERSAAIENAGLPGSVRAWASDAARTLAVIEDDDGAERFFVSKDDGRSWKEGPQPPREVYELDVRPGGRVVAAWAWSASCGGGGEGDASWSTGRRSWTERARTTIAAPGADDWLYVPEHDSAASGRVVIGHGPRGEVALGPQVPEDAATWVATDGRSTFIGMGSGVLTARRGVFAPYDDVAPEGLREVSVDGRGRLIGLTRAGIVRRERHRVWSELTVPPATPPPSTD